MNQTLPPLDAAVRQAVFASLSTTGATPSPQDVADSLGIMAPRFSVADGLRAPQLPGS